MSLYFFIDLKIGVGCTLSVSFPATLVCVLFGTAIPAFKLFFLHTCTYIPTYTGSGLFAV